MATGDHVPEELRQAGDVIRVREVAGKRVRWEQDRLPDPRGLEDRWSAMHQPRELEPRRPGSQVDELGTDRPSQVVAVRERPSWRHLPPRRQFGRRPRRRCALTPRSPAPSILPEAARQDLRRGVSQEGHHGWWTSPSPTSGATKSPAKLRIGRADRLLLPGTPGSRWRAARCHPHADGEIRPWSQFSAIGASALDLAADRPSTRERLRGELRDRDLVQARPRLLVGVGPALAHVVRNAVQSHMFPRESIRLPRWSKTCSVAGIPTMSNVQTSA